MGLLQQAASGNAGRGACPPARGHRRRPQARAAGGRRASRSPAECPSPKPAGGRRQARSAIGRPTASSGGCNLHTEVERRTRFLMARIVPDKTAGESVGAQLDMFSPLPAGARVSVTHDNGTGSPTTKGCATGWAWPRTSPTRTPAGSGEATRTGGMIRRYHCPNAARYGWTAKGRSGDRRRDQQPPHARARLPHARRGVRRRTVKLQDQQNCCTSK